jgi:uncharacterized protein (TIGR03067 family)
MFTVSLLILGSSLAAPAADDAAKKAQDALQGTWVATALEEKGKKASAEEVKEENFSITIKGNELALRHGDGTPERFFFTLDPSKKPAHIDLKRLGEDAPKGTLHAIYALEKGELKICLGSNFTPNKPEERPQEFATVLGSEKRPPKGKIMFTFKQDKK